METVKKKRITDPIYGTIQLTELETQLLSTRPLQRLRNIKQLGLANYVFPGADYSRLSHSIGACHVMGRIINTLKQNTDLGTSDQITDLETKYRVAALLHDLGHLPFSHCSEYAAKEYYKNGVYKNVTQGNDLPAPTFRDHENIGKIIITCDEQIKRILSDNNLEPEEIASIITKDEPNTFNNLLSSDIDADRIDYLLRTAHHSGLPYGRVDIEYLLSQLRIDTNNHICLSEKALKSADHLLLCRYFDYQQLTYHKTVVGLELILRSVIKYLIEEKLIDLSFESITNLVTTGDWFELDDLKMFSLFRDAKKQCNDEKISIEISSILERTPPTLIGSFEWIASREEEIYKERLHNVERLKKEFSKLFKIPEELWYIWAPGGKAITSIGSLIPVGNVEMLDPELASQAVMILDNDGSSKMLMEMKQSLMRVLSNYSLYVLRLRIPVKKAACSG